VWEVDVFEGSNKGLVVAEVELDSEDEAFSLPRWVTQEVTDDVRYFNSNLMENPYSEWKPCHIQRCDNNRTFNI